MKVHLIIGFCFLFSAFFAQGQENTIKVPATNNSMNNSVSEPKQDTTVIEFENVNKSTYKKNDTKTPVKTKEKSKLEQSEQSFDKESSSFKQVKYNAATQSTQRSPSPEQQLEMNKTVNFYGNNAPNSFEYHYFKYAAGNYNVALIDNLLAAQKLKPNSVDVHVQLAAYHFIKEENKALKEDLEFLLKNKKIEEEVLVYATDILNSVEENGTLLTHGFDDTYSVMYLQEVKKIRTDVRLISVDFMQSEFYRNVLKKDKFSLPAETVIDVAYLEKFCRLNASRNLQLSMTFPKPYLKEILSDLQILGLTFAYKKEAANLFEKNQTFYLNSFQANKVSKYKTEKCKKLSSNYLPFLLSLEEGYEKTQDKEQLKEIRELISKIKTQAKVTKSLNSY
ncbi:MAG: hypothetical protein K0R65_885 [Crocinitomicaceae bacterium]|jgi:hypothetical protein|nr:hypothetical protein [Crocinitomicaceae bacterium]